MKLLLAISILFSVQASDPGTLDKFAKTQSGFYNIDTNPKVKLLATAIGNYQLHSLKSELALKSKKEHSATDSEGRTLYSRINICKYDFETEEKCLQAQDSLLNNFPGDPGTVKRGVDQGQKITPSIIVFGSKSIVIAITACESADQKWTVFKKDLVKAFAGETDQIIVADCGKLYWSDKAKILASK